MAAEADAANALQRLRYFAHFSDTDGLIYRGRQARGRGAAALYEDVLLKEKARPGAS